MSSRILRAIGVIALAIAVSVAAIYLGRWQYHRHEVRAEAIEAFERGQAAPVVPLEQAVPAGSTELPPGVEWSRVTVTGTFDPDTLTWLRNRPVDGTPAVHALAYLMTEDDRALLVNAGWVDAGTQSRPSLPAGRVDVVVLMREQEEDDGRRDDGATRIVAAQVPTVAVETIPGYGMVEASCTPEGTCAPLPGLTPAPLPSLSLGPHLAYAWQWWILALAAPTIAVVVVVRETREDREPSRGTTPRRPRRTREPSDEDIEDAL